MDIQSIAFEQVTHEYGGGIVALHDLTLGIEPGVFGLLGPNGAGKTTMMRILATLLRPSAGQVHVGPFSVVDRHDRWQIREKLGYVPQDSPLYPHLSGAEFLEYMAAAKQLGSKARRRATVTSAIETMGLTSVARRRINTLSGGMKRRVAVAQALLGEPEVLIADEPMAGMDPQERLRFRTFIGQLGKQCLVLISSHIVEDLAHMCDTVGILYQGRLVFYGTPAELVAVAEGRVWELAGDLPFRSDCVIVSQGRQGIPHRLLHAESPHADAVAITATMEDGYMWFLGHDLPQRASARA